ncbi:ATP-binding cassette domain-containing protein [Syntrophomonas erecta]
MSLNVENITHIYQPGSYFSRTAIKDLSFSLPPGEIIGMMGREGSGKSTLLKILSGFLKPTRGKVTLDGQDLHRLNKKGLLAGQVGLVMQFPEQQIFAGRVFDEIAFGPRNVSISSKDIEGQVRQSMQALDMDYEAYADRKPETLSSGEKRRVAVASIMAMAPRYLLLDEPLAGLDHPGRQHLLHALQQINIRRGTGILIVSHQLRYLLPLCNRLIFLDQGQIVQELTCGKESTIDLVSEQFNIELPLHLQLVQELKEQGWELSSHFTSLEATCQEIAMHIKRDDGQLVGEN